MNADRTPRGPLPPSKSQEDLSKDELFWQAREEIMDCRRRWSQRREIHVAIGWQQDLHRQLRSAVARVDIARLRALVQMDARPRKSDVAVILAACAYIDRLFDFYPRIAPEKLRSLDPATLTLFDVLSLAEGTSREVGMTQNDDEKLAYVKEILRPPQAGLAAMVRSVLNALKRLLWK